EPRGGIAAVAFCIPAGWAALRVRRCAGRTTIPRQHTRRGRCLDGNAADRGGELARGARPRSLTRHTFKILRRDRVEKRHAAARHADAVAPERIAAVSSRLGPYNPGDWPPESRHMSVS